MNFKSAKNTKEGDIVFQYESINNNYSLTKDKPSTVKRVIPIYSTKAPAYVSDDPKDGKLFSFDFELKDDEGKLVQITKDILYS